MFIGHTTKLDQTKIEWDTRSAMGVVLATNGYPDAYPSNEIIGLPADNESAKVFHAGTKMDGGNIVSSGGRVYVPLQWVQTPKMHRQMPTHY